MYSLLTISKTTIVLFYLFIWLKQPLYEETMKEYTGIRKKQAHKRGGD